VTLLSDQVIAVPARAKPVLDRFGQSQAVVVDGGLGAIAASLRARLRPARRRLARSGYRIIRR